jgi:uncharacterized phage-associated protein
MTDQKAPAVGEISAHEWAAWRHNPVTKLYRRYLAEKRAFIERAALDQWISGVLSLQADQTIRGQIIELAELGDLPFEAVYEFFKDQEAVDAAPPN